MNTILTDMNIFSWKEWEMPTYHERLKPSYYIMRDAFNSINLQNNFYDYRATKTVSSFCKVMSTLQRLEAC